VGDDGSGEELRPRLLALARRLLSLTCPTPLHYMCRSKMALEISGSLKYLLRADSENIIPGTSIVCAK